MKNNSAGAEVTFGYDKVCCCGHEGAGIGLAPGTGHLVAQAVTGAATSIPLEPYRPDRFDDQKTDGDVSAEARGNGD